MNTASTEADPGRRIAGALLRMGLYVVLVLTPLIIVGVVRPKSDHGFIYTTGKNLALVGFTILALQFVLSARLKWVERPFGLNLLFDFHKTMAVFASLLLISHPLLLAMDEGGWGLIFGPEISWHLWLGRIALLILLMHVLLGLFRFVIKLNYQTWRFVHDLGAGLLLPLGFFHSWNAGGDFALPALRLFWAILLAAALAAFLWHRAVRPLLLKQRPYEVVDVKQEARDTWTIRLAPPAGVSRFDFLPGQFHFLTFYRASNLPVEEHHWTISSSPAEPEIVASTIKESGDFTVSIGKTKPGDKALVYGAFGRFSYTLHPDERDLVFIAAGIGITPLMSMLRHMRDTRADRRVLLIYSNRGEDDIVFDDELRQMEGGAHPQLKVVHVLTRPAESWTGETGRLHPEKLDRVCPVEVRHRAFYICTPPALIDAISKWLRHCAVPPKNIHFERFNL
jgi:predicted ferric reductase